MKQIAAALLLIITIVGLIGGFFTYRQVASEEKRLRSDIQYRSTLLAENIRESVEPNFLERSDYSLETIVKRFSTTERFAGLAIVNNKGEIIATSSALPKELSEAQTITADVMDSDKANGDFFKSDGKKMYAFAIPLHEDESVVGALMVVQNAGYIDTRLAEIWKNNFIRLFIQSSLISLATLLIFRWIIYLPVKNLVDSIKSARLEKNPKSSKNIPNYPLFKPLVRELSNIQQSLVEARLSASAEARLRKEKVDSPWTEERLKEYIKDTLKGRGIFVVSNREPYIHYKNKNRINYYIPASGMATAVEPIMQATGGTWIAHGSGDADREVVDKNDKIRVPPDEPKYSLRRVWLTEQEEQGFYYGFSNEGLWPLCHIAHTRPIFRNEDWEEYRTVNGKFAKVVIEEIKNMHQPFILIQDFHFALLPKMIKKSRPDAVIGLFWHVPWPNAESFSICPFRKELLDGMLGADLIGFHTQLHCNNFIDTIGRELESLIDWERFAVTRSGHVSFIKPFPISIAFDNVSSTDESLSEKDKKEIRQELKITAKYIGLGVDRLDYTKGILERFKAIDFFLENYPKYQKQFVFIQIAPLSRSNIPAYRQFENEVTEEAERINNKYKSNGWKPIHLFKKHHSHKELNRLYQIADVCLVTSLHDGMNLVAKEFTAARSDNRGVLILSKFAGASRELKNAIIVNPYNIQQMAESIKKGLEMPETEKMKRMRKMRREIVNFNVYRWSADLFKTMTDLAK